MPKVSGGNSLRLMQLHRLGRSMILHQPKLREPATSVEELETLVESVEEIVTSIFHRPKYMKDLCGTKVRKDDAGSVDHLHGVITSLQQEIESLKSGGGPEAIAAAEERATELEKELEKTKSERDEVLQWLKISDKELNEARGDLSEAQRQLKEARVRARRADDELLKLMMELESARVELGD
ncbi:hypothetical protein BHE74_00013457 [Ensete ventricosum]|nr:hypothetical protein BHE74_00013457 [Ensete ventricosum]